MKALVLVTVAPGKAEEAQARVKGIKGIKEALLVAGRADLALFIEGSLEEVNSALEEVWKVEGVETTETLLEVA